MVNLPSFRIRDIQHSKSNSRLKVAEKSEATEILNRHNIKLYPTVSILLSFLRLVSVIIYV